MGRKRDARREKGGVGEGEGEREKTKELIRKKTKTTTKINVLNHKRIVILNDKKRIL